MQYTLQYLLRFHNSYENFHLRRRSEAKFISICSVSFGSFNSNLRIICIQTDTKISE